MQKHEPLLIVARHGATCYNLSEMGKDQKIRGWIDLPLTDGGKKEAADLAAKVSGYPIEEMLSSDLVRAEETAQIVADKIGLPVVVTRKLRPWDLGLMAGRKVSEVSAAMDNFVTNENVKVPQGESFENFKQRLLPFIARMAHKAHKDSKVIMLCTHTRCLQLCKAWLVNGAPADLSIDRSTMDDYSSEASTGGFIEVFPHMVLGPEFKPESIQNDPDSSEE